MLLQKLKAGGPRAAGAGLLALLLSTGAAPAQTVTLAQGVDPESLDPANRYVDHQRQRNDEYL